MFAVHKHMNTKVLMSRSATMNWLKTWEMKTSMTKAGEGSLLPFTILSRRLTDKWMVGAGTSTHTQTRASITSSCFFHPEKYYPRIPELFMHHRKRRWPPYYFHHVCWGLSYGWKRKVLWSGANAVTLSCFSMLSLWWCRPCDCRTVAPVHNNAIYPWFSHPYRRSVHRMTTLSS